MQNHGFEAKEAIIEIRPREGEFWIREEDILGVIERQGSEIALVLFGGLSYYSGQWFGMKAVTAAARAKVRSTALRMMMRRAEDRRRAGMPLWVGLGPRGR